MNTLMMAADCAAKCPPHAIIAVVGALAVGFIAGRLSARKGCACKKHAASSPRPVRHEAHAGETRAPIPAGSVEIYVGNLSYDLTEEQLRKEFEAFGTVASARVVTNRYNNRSKGFGFVVMPNRPEAEKAIEAMNDKDVLGRKMRVNEAKNTVVQDA